MIIHLATRRGIVGHAITGAPWPHHEIVDLGSEPAGEARLDRLVLRAKAFGDFESFNRDSEDVEPVWEYDGLKARNEAEAVALGMARGAMVMA